MTNSTYATYKLDAVEFLRQFPDASVDLVATDPAYESMEKHRKIGTTTRLKHSKASSNDWFQIFPNSRFPEFVTEVFRVLKKDRHFYMMCDSETMFVVKPLGEEAGFKFWKDLIWDKVAIGMGYHWRAQNERILFFEKGKRKLNNLGWSDVIPVKRIRNGYPTEKPIPLLERLIANSTQLGELVVDPFMGSGVTGVAALQIGRSFMGSDIGDEAISVSNDRLMRASLGEPVEQ